MNESLQKDTVSDTEKIQRRKMRLKRYMTRHKTMCVTLNTEKDNDILSWLGEQENRSEAIREALKQTIRDQKMKNVFVAQTKGGEFWEEE